MKSWLGVVGLLCVVGCSSDDADDEAKASPYDALYTPAAIATADTAKIDGLWETTLVNGEVTSQARIQFKDGKIQFASRCTGPGYETVTVGVTVSATWADSKITVSDPGGQDQKTSNGPTGKPPLVCVAKLTGPGSTSYSLGDSKLQTLGFSFTKITD